MNLYEVMEHLLVMAEGLFDAGLGHENVCHELANHFNLWRDDQFPVWLSRVVEGVARDMEE